jgi:hypothetical protein
MEWKRQRRNPNTVMKKKAPEVIRGLFSSVYLFSLRHRYERALVFSQIDLARPGDLLFFIQ